MKKLDMTGKPCPIPVVEAKKLLARPDTGTVEVLVDNIVAVQNLEKMANGTGCVFAYEKESDALYRVTIEKGANTGELLPQPAEGVDESTAEDTAEGPTVLITSRYLGEGSDELGGILMKGFIFSLTELSPPPKTVIFMNSGVWLTIERAATIADLLVLVDKGTRVITCGTCVNFYELSGKLGVGYIANMMEITSHLAEAQTLITL